MKKVTVLVTYSYDLEIDENSPIVKEYENQKELIEDCASYRFLSTLPVINNGVEVVDISVAEVDIQN